MLEISTTSQARQAKLKTGQFDSEMSLAQTNPITYVQRWTLEAGERSMRREERTHKCRTKPQKYKAHRKSPRSPYSRPSVAHSLSMRSKPEEVAFSKLCSPKLPTMPFGQKMWRGGHRKCKRTLNDHYEKAAEPVKANNLPEWKRIFESFSSRQSMFIHCNQPNFLACLWVKKVHGTLWLVLCTKISHGG